MAEGAQLALDTAPAGTESEEQETVSYVGMSQLQVTPEQATQLAQPIPVEDLDILPSGELYASQVRYRRILNATFGPGGWALRPRGRWVLDGSTLCREYALFVRGCFVSESVGECEFQENNPRMTRPTAMEAAKSNALIRTCKDLGIASECWDRHFCDTFQAEQCVRVLVSERGASKVRWRRKDARPFYGEVKVLVEETDDDGTPQPPAMGATPRVIPPDASITEPQRKRLFAVARVEGRHTVEAVERWLKDTYSIESTKDIKRGAYDEIVERLRKSDPLNNLDADL